MMAVNLGTGTPKDAVELLEYCNGDMPPTGRTSAAKTAAKPPTSSSGASAARWTAHSRSAQTGHGNTAASPAGQPSSMKMFEPTTIRDRRLRRLYRMIPTFGTWEEGGPPRELSLRRLSVRSISIIRTMRATS